MLKIVITTINGPDSSVKSWHDLGDLLIVPDEKTPGEQIHDKHYYKGL